ncbi:hypothetical protein VNO77_04001 [Canavalia gladiata]|uniref:Uncharacterized protein n=1 Tax=Canavalia gladiata TaxID=3824 RepID=A0AAN9R8N7_CANGL
MCCYPFLIPVMHGPGILQLPLYIVPLRILKGLDELVLSQPTGIPVFAPEFYMSLWVLRCQTHPANSRRMVPRSGAYSIYLIKHWTSFLRTHILIDNRMR